MKLHKNTILGVSWVNSAYDAVLEKEVSIEWPSLRGEVIENDNDKIIIDWFLAGTKTRLTLEKQ